ncbi:hypothetical protein AX15_005746 [Amanita polypyramis BW_CC]|nr:hypothetical protein AX15_005746 [Amanita polypyramis BW_CC]
MQIQFNPNLGKTITVSPPFFIPRTPSCVLVRFTALLLNGKHERMSKDGGKVQLWSNCPSDTPAGWQAYDFAESTRIGTDEQQLSLYLPVILSPGVTRLEFCYTYRVMYPDGQIIWFGRFEQDGTCIIDRDGSCVLLNDEWYNKDDTTYEFNTNGDSSSLEIIRGIEMERVNVHAINSDGIIGCNERCSLLFITSKYEPDSYIMPQAISISSSSGSSLSLSSAGSISIDDVAKTSLLLQIYDERTVLLPELQRAVSHSVSEKGRALSLRRDDGVFVLGNLTTYPHPLRLVAIQLFPVTDARTTEVQLDLSEYRELFAHDINGACIYPSPGSDIATISRGDITSVRLLMELGTQYTLSSECHLRSRGKLWRISILSDYTNIRMSFHEPDAGALPMLPPSPYVHHEGPITSNGIIYSAAGKAYPTRSTRFGRFGIYMRCICALVITSFYAFFRILSVLKRGRSDEQKGNHIGRQTRKTDPKLWEKHESRDQSTPDGLSSSQPGFCKSLCARVPPGVLTILLRSERGSVIHDPASMFDIRLDGKKLETSIKHKDSSAYLLTSFIDKDGEIEIAST